MGWGMGLHDSAITNLGERAVPHIFSFPNVIFTSAFGPTPPGTDGRDFIFGSAQDDVIDAGAGNDLVFGRRGDDTISVGAGRDVALGGAGDDTFLAGGGDNRYNGGRGSDTAVFAGALEEYELNIQSRGRATITRSETAAEGAGRDRLIGVETASFASGETIFLDGRNNAAIARDDQAALTEDGGAIAVADLLANDIEVDGDDLVLVSVDATSAGGATLSLEGGAVTYDAGDAFDALGAGQTATDTFSYVVGDGQGGTDTATVTVTVTGVNDGPVLADPGALSQAENTTDVLVTLTATDADGDDLSFAIAGGADAALFEVDAETGALRFLNAPDFEMPGDAGADNGYDVTVAVSDGQGGTDAVDLVVSVTDAVEGPSLVISEVMYNPASGEPAWEWVEIVNTGASEIDLAGWVFDDTNSVFQAGANIASGTIAAGGSAVLYNADALSADDFTAAWGAGINLIGVTDWSRASLNNGGDTFALWDSFDAYAGDEVTAANVVVSLAYDDSGAWPSDDGAGSIYLTDLAADASDGANWALSEAGVVTPVNVAQTGGEAGEDVGSPGGQAPQAQFVINEVDADTPGTDTAEFIELYDGGLGNQSLDGLSVVLYNGSDDASYQAFDLDGFSTDADGFFVLGNDGVNGASLTFGSNGLQNGADAVALVRGDASDFPNDTPLADLDASTLVDALVYGTGDADDAELLAGLGQSVQYDEDANGQKDTQSVSRNPDGGDFVTQDATPGASNVDDGTGPGDATPRLISEVQGGGAASDLVGDVVTVTAIVVGDFQDGDGDEARNLGGFWLQEELTDSDGNAATSEGIFVADDGTLDVAIGDRVQVTGSVEEFFGNTRIVADQVSVVDAGAVADINTLAAELSLDAIDDVISLGGTDYLPDLEAYEGMLVTITDTLTVNETFNLDRFNEVRLTAGDRPEQFTQLNAPDAAGFDAYQQQIASDQIIFDDGLGIQNAPIFAEADLDGDGDYDTADGFGMGDTTTNLTGVLDYSFSEFRIRGAEDGVNSFEDTLTREDTPPDVGGTLTVSSFNVLNFFTTIDVDGAGSGPNLLEPRGADSIEEFDRQLEKLLTTLNQLDADIFGLVELENEFGTDQNGDGLIAIDVIVDGLNGIYGPGTWAAVDPGRGFVDTGDAISVGMIYKTQSVSLVEGSVEILDDSDLDGLGFGALDDDGTGVFDGPSTNRAPLAATFVDAASGEDFSVAVTHMKSKGGTGEGGNADQGDGAAAFNELRTEGVNVTTAWLDQIADEDVLVLGDFNAYLKEEPITAIEAAGYTNLEEVFNPGSTTFVFDGQTGTLDYAFANDALADNVTGAGAWQINSPEPDAQDYNLDFGRDPEIFDGDVSYRASDHDPLLVGLDFGASDPLTV